MQSAEVLLLVTDALESLGITYCVGGSFASSAYGEPRATRDVDMLVALPAVKAALFAARLAPDFFVQLSELRDAIALVPSLRDDPSAVRRATSCIAAASSGLTCSLRQAARTSSRSLHGVFLKRSRSTPSGGPPL